MTPREIRKQIEDMEAGIGKRSRVWAAINRDGDASLTGSIYTNWPGGDAAVTVKAEDWAELFSNLHEAWLAHQDKYRAGMIQKMALKIISVTDKKGECTDADLRGYWDFTDAQVQEFGDAACAKANEMAGKGPFEIVRIRGANAA